jgi:hypothetical protein
MGRSGPGGFSGSRTARGVRSGGGPASANTHYSSLSTPT